MKLIIFGLILLGVRLSLGQNVDVLKKYDSPKSATFSCNQDQINFDPQSIDELTLNCSLPNSYAKLLSDFQFTSVKTLILNIDLPNSNYTLNSTLFEHLNVTQLVINCKYFNVSSKVEYVKLESNFLYVLNDITELEIHGVAVVQAGKIDTENLETAQCASLHTLMITTSDLRRAPSGWLRVCKKLQRLHISQLRQRNGTKEVRRKILAEAKSLRHLEILNCFIEELEDELQDLENLQTLNVAHNQIHYALTTIVLPNLVELDLSYNHIFSSALLSSGVERQPKLRVLSLDYNTVLDICDNLGYRTTMDVEKENASATWHRPLSGRQLNLNSIQRFSLRGTITTNMCFGHLNMDSLEYFDLSDSKISAINFRALPVSKARRLEVNVSGCPLRDIPGFTFGESDYNQLRHEELRISGLNISLLCDCDEYLWLAKASRERRLILSGAICANGKDLATVTDDQLQCNKYNCGACTCRRYWQDNSTDVECNGELHAIPREPGLRRLYAAGNLVENVTADDLPDTLIYLDLSKNHIARMSEEASKALFKNPERRVRFYGNPIICDCENSPFILQLMDHFDKVEDYGTLMCIDDGRLIRNVDPTDLCFGTSRRFLTVLIGTLGAFIGIVALCVGLYFRFGRALKVYLYSKGLCLFCIRESEVDADREYDAFVSFSHIDESFVTQHLLPGLENEPYNYKLCVHYRNWIAGELIPAQINQSIKNSKRTIIVLSKSFLDSIWGLLEFRTAHLSALKEGRSRLIIIIIDDILETGNLDGELRSYLHNNTYVKWGDPWFWNKLRYALPHKSIRAVDVKIDTHKEDTGNSNQPAETKQDSSTERNTEESRIDETEVTKEDLDDKDKIDVKSEFKDSGQCSKEMKEEIESDDKKAKDLSAMYPIRRAESTDSAIEMVNY